MQRKGRMGIKVAEMIGVQEVQRRAVMKEECRRCKGKHLWERFIGVQ